MNDIEIDYNEKSGRFMITSPPWRVNLMRGIPNRRWEKSKKVWSAPAVARNVDYLRSALMGAKFTAAAKDAIMLVEQNKAVSAPRIPFPADYPFKKLPYAHQKRALDRVYSLDHCALLMAMRTGKTKVCIDLNSQRFIERKINASVVVCPKSIRKNWQEQIGDNCPVPHSTWLYQPGSSKKAVREYEEWAYSRTDNMRWLVFSIESLSQGSAFKTLEKFLLSHSASMNIDESSKIKNHKAERTDQCIRMGLYAIYRMIMTGSLITQSVMDAYSQFEFVDTAIIGIGDFYSFRNRYAVMGGYEDKQIIGYQNVEELMANIGPYSFECRITDVFPDMPLKIGPVKRYVEKTKEQKELLRQIKRERSFKLPGMTEADELENALEISLRQQQVVGGFMSITTDHPVLKKKDGSPKKVVAYHAVPGANPKMVELLAAIEEIEGPTVIWARYAPEISAIVTELSAKYGADQVAQYWGQIDEEERERERLRFQEKKKRFFVSNQMTGGMGLDLSTAEVVIYYSNTFSLIEREQSEERPYGPKIKHSVLYIDLVCEDSIDEHVLASLNEKRNFSEYVKQAIRDNSLGRVLGDD
jgi:hypothetical protein